MSHDEFRAGPIAGWRTGEGSDVVVVLHGGPGLSDYTEPLVDELRAALHPDARPVAFVRYQQRGLPPSVENGPYTVEQHVEDLATVIDALGTDPVTLVGHSWGGHLAMHAAVTIPERLRAIVMIDPLGGVGDGGASEMVPHFMALLTEDERRERQRLDALRESAGSSEALELANVALVWKCYFAEPASAPEMPPMRMSAECGADTWASIAGHLDDGTLCERLPVVGLPALFLAGTRSPIPSSASIESAALIPGSQVELAPTGHFPWLEQPGWVGECVARFVASIG